MVVTILSPSSEFIVVALSASRATKSDLQVVERELAGVLELERTQHRQGPHKHSQNRRTFLPDLMIFGKVLKMAPILAYLSAFGTDFRPLQVGTDVSERPSPPRDPLERRSMDHADPW